MEGMDEKNWEYIKIVSIEKGENLKDETGNILPDFEVIITTDLGPISPWGCDGRDMQGIMDKNGQFNSMGMTPMRRLGEIWEGFYSYAATATTDDREGYGFFFHVVPTP